MNYQKLCLFFCILIFISVFTIYGQSLGDVNESGGTDIVDALLIAQYYVGLDPANFNADVADVDCSGGPDIVDALLVAQYYVGLISQFPCSPTAGPTDEPTSPPDNTPEPTGGLFDCTGVPEWDASAVYETEGMRVVYNGNLYENNWYSSGQNPEENSGEFDVWVLLGICDPAITPSPTPTPAPTPTPTPTLDPNATPVPTREPGSAYIPWDWTHTVGTGQSLAVGTYGTPYNLTTQPYNNLKLSTGNLAWPVDPDDSSLTMVPLVEPVGRIAPSYPSSWPENIAGETQHGAMGNQVTSMVQSEFGVDYVGVHGEFGENGQGMIYLKKDAPQDGINGRAFEATLIEVQAVKRLADAAGKSYGVAAIIITHGETDSGNTNYENELYQLWSDYNTDIKAITGQSDDLLMIVSQQNSCGDNSASTVAQWKVGVDYPENIVCSGPKYQYPYSSDAVHLVTEGYELNGEKYGQIYYERIILGNDWQPLQPLSAVRNGNVITVEFNVPVPPLVWDTSFQTPHQSETEWSNGKGFEVYASSSARITIDSVSISGNSVIITCASDPGANCRVDYAMAQNSDGAMSTPFGGTTRWGLLRDSDPFTGSTTNQNQPNWCVSFQMTIP